jgi:hypothetical protein
MKSPWMKYSNKSARTIKLDDQLKLGRNSKCPCGSNRKYKVCCLRKGDVRVKMQQVHSLIKQGDSQLR